MGTFHSIDELIKTLDREKVLLKEMFAKRHSLQFRYDYALEMTEYKEERIRYLIENGVIRATVWRWKTCIRSSSRMCWK